MSEIEGLLAVRVVTPTLEEFQRTRDFYRSLLGRSEDGAFGDQRSVHQAAFFRLGDVELIITREEGATPESKIDQGAVWLCFRTADPDALFEQARQRQTALPHAPVNTSFGTRAFFANDPMGLPVYVGTPWNHQVPDSSVTPISGCLVEIAEDATCACFVPGPSPVGTSLPASPSTAG